MNCSTLQPELLSCLSDNQVSNDVTVYCQLVSELAESPLWHAGRESLFWLDILSNRLYEKPLSGMQVQYWDLPETVSSVAIDSQVPDTLWLISARHMVRFTLSTAQFQRVLPLPLDGNYRTNDGAVSPDGRYWFGTMLRQPQAEKGQVYSIGPAGDLLLELNAIAIPNTFCWLDSHNVLISDSLQQICQHYQINAAGKAEVASTLLDLRQSPATPDGGAVDNNGNIWLALWGGAKVVCVSAAGKQLAELPLPVPQPSSCCFGGPENNILFITSAREGLTPEQLLQFPDSGKIFYVQLPVQGAAVPQYSVV